MQPWNCILSHPILELYTVPSTGQFCVASLSLSDNFYQSQPLQGLLQLTIITMSSKKDSNVMRDIKIEKLVLNISAGTSSISLLSRTSRESRVECRRHFRVEDL